MIRPTLHPILCGTIARSPLTTSLFPLVVVRPVIVSSRTLTSSSRLLSGPNNPSHAPSTLQKRGIHDTQAKSASTALKPEVREKEKDQTGGRVVGDEVPGSEGPHYQDQIPPTANPLHDMAGQWTMMNPIYSDAELDTVKIVHRPAITVSDRVVANLVKLLRRSFDLATGYRNIPISEATLAMNPLPVKELREKGQLLSDKNWLLRIILLESIAGVPGMVAGTLRHLRSLRLLRRDGGWIHTALEEAENERMHLLTFMTIAQPSWFLRALVLSAQGVFYNLFFFTYLVAPKTAHRFVGYLEEEAVRTYTHCISDIEKGLVPEWKNVPAPRIAIDYWRLPDSAKLLDVIRAVRADEATHRFVNHSLANLDQKRDFNPFALGEADPETRGSKAGFTRDESAEFAKQSLEKLQDRAAIKGIGATKS